MEAVEKTRTKKTADETEANTFAIKTIAPAAEDTEQVIAEKQIEIPAADDQLKTPKDQKDKDKLSDEKTAAKGKAPRKFKKAQLLASKQFEREEKYFLEAILHEDQEYTIKEAQDALSKTLAKGVK